MIKLFAGVGMILVLFGVIILQFAMVNANMNQKQIGRINNVALVVVIVSMGCLSYIFFIK